MAVIEIVEKMVSVGVFELWSDDVGIFRKAVWWLEKCCSVVVRVRRRLK